jgi:amino acid adenylation domain-containing protein
VPLDPAYPAERLAFMLKDLETPILITRRALNVVFPGFTGIVIDLDTVWERVAEQPTTAPETPVSSREPVYMIYTSGSTGEPKAAVIEHRSLVNHLLAARQIYGMHPEDRVFQTNSISFDFSVQEIFLALSSGATLILQPDMWLGSIADFLDKTAASGATVLDLPTAVWHELVLAMEAEAGKLTLPPSVRLVAVGGERMIPQRLAQWYRHVGERVDVINVYGPTETTIAVTLSSVRAVAPQAGSRSEIPVGCPLPNTAFYVLDTHQQLMPIGVPGELYIGGVALARGYWKRPELTAERFVRHLFSTEPGARLYRSGDLARFRPDGTLEIVGRLDSQVKVRGFRVELGEIETRLRQWPGLQDAVAGVHVNAQGDKHIVAYLVPQAGSPLPTDAALRQFLGQVLPGYMLPLPSWCSMPCHSLPTEKSIARRCPRRIFCIRLLTRQLQVWRRIIWCNR